MERREGSVIMQARRGIEAEATLREHKGRHAGCCSVVVKAVVDQPTQRAALLLADSSCLLVSLSTRTAVVVPITVPAPCSDACFLRLHSGSGPKFGNGLSPSGFGEVAERGVLRIAQEESRETESRETGNLPSGGNGRTVKGQGLWGATRRELFVVTTRPAQGGSCTDLRAWSCGADPASFARADIELELGCNKRVRSRDELYNPPSSLARLDAPHGLAVKMAASINVLVIYSSSAGKFWILSGKWSDQTSGGPAQTVMGNKDVFGSQGPDNRKRLVLMKCAVVRCHGPVYSIHVSPSHLFLGEGKGVRVWALRPLIKPGSISGNSSLQSKPRQFKHVTSEQGNSYQSSNTTLDCERGCERGYRCQHGMESSSAASGRITEKTCIGNENADLDANNVDLRDNMRVATAMKKLPMRKGLFSIGEELDVGANFTGIGNYYRKLQLGSGGHSRVRSFEFWSLSQMQEALKSDSNLENVSAEDDMAGKTTMGNGGVGVIKNETRKGATLRSYPGPEHGGVSVNEIITVGSKGDSIITSSAGGAVPSNECTGNNYPLKTAPRLRTGITPVAESQLVTGTHPLASQLVSEEVLQQSGPTGSRVERKTNMDSSAGMWFVALSGTKEGVATRPSPQLQVVDMQGLSLKEYVVLDSKGELHLLTLHDVSKERNNFVSLGSRAPPTLRPLQITMRVTSFAVLPLPPPLSRAHRDFVSPAEVTERKLWISDGMYSVHIVILPEEKTKGSIGFTTTSTTLAVSQAVFMKDCVDGLFAGSPDTVVVLTKGKLVSYVMPGG